MEVDVRNLGAQELLEQQGSTLVVFHPGSTSLYVGLASSSAPERVPHCLAYHRHRPAHGDDAPSTPATAPPPPAGDAAAPQTPAQQAALQKAREELGLVGEPRTPSLAPQTQPPPVSAGFEWTRCRAGEGDAADASWRGVLVADEVARLAPGEPYDVAWPMQGGRLHGLASLPPHRVADQVEEVWRWALRRRLRLGQGQWAAMGAVLVVPPQLDADEVRLLAEVLLSRLGFDCLVVHLEPVATAFGCNSCSVACVVNIGNTATSVACVEEGIITHASHLQLPVGADAVGTTLLGLLSAAGAWPGGDEAEGVAALPEALAAGRQLSPFERALVEEFVGSGCYLPKESVAAPGRPVLEDARPTPLVVHRPRQLPVSSYYLISLGDAACLAPMCLFLPAMLPPASLAAARGAAAAAAPRAQPTAASCGRVELMPAAERAALQLLVDARPGPPPLSAYIPSSVARPPTAPVAPPAAAPAAEPGDGAAASHTAEADAAVGPPPGLDEAIVAAILAGAAGRPGAAGRLFANVVVTGPGSALRGLADMLERRVLARLPHDCKVNMVEVREPPFKAAAPTLAWRGGALLGALDSSDNWLYRVEWCEGAHGANRHTRLFTYCRAQQGVGVGT